MGFMDTLNEKQQRSNSFTPTFVVNDTNKGGTATQQGMFRSPTTRTNQVTNNLTLSPLVQYPQISTDINHLIPSWKIREGFMNLPAEKKQEIVEAIKDGPEGGALERTGRDIPYGYESWNGVPAGMLSGTYDPSKGVIGGLNSAFQSAIANAKTYAGSPFGQNMMGGFLAGMTGTPMGIAAGVASMFQSPLDDPAIQGVIAATDKKYGTTLAKDIMADFTGISGKYSTGFKDVMGLNAAKEISTKSLSGLSVDPTTGKVIGLDKLDPATRNQLAFNNITHAYETVYGRAALATTFSRTALAKSTLAQVQPFTAFDAISGLTRAGVDLSALNNHAFVSSTMVTPKTVKQTFENMMPGDPLAAYAAAHTTKGMMDPANKDVANLEASARAKSALGISSWSEQAAKKGIDQALKDMAREIAKAKADIENGVAPKGTASVGDPNDAGGGSKTGNGQENESPGQGQSQTGPGGASEGASRDGR